MQRELSREVLPYVIFGQMMGGFGNEFALRPLIEAKLQSLRFCASRNMRPTRSACAT